MLDLACLGIEINLRVAKPVDDDGVVSQTPCACHAAADDHDRANDASAWVHSGCVLLVEREGALLVRKQIDVEATQKETPVSRKARPSPTT